MNVIIIKTEDSVFPSEIKIKIIYRQPLPYETCKHSFTSCLSYQPLIRLNHRLHVSTIEQSSNLIKRISAAARETAPIPPIN